MIDFNKNAWHSGTVVTADREAADSFETKILACMEKDKDRRFELGCLLIQLFDSRAYIVVSNGYGHAQYFWQFCEERFRLDKSTVSRYMNVVDEFGDGFKGFHKRWREYSWAVLVEMIPMSPMARDLIKPNMTRAQVREIKKNFVAPAQQEVKPDKNVVLSGSDKAKIDAMKKIYGGMSTDELMLELYRLREELARYEEEKQKMIEDAKEDFEVEGIPSL